MEIGGVERESIRVCVRNASLWIKEDFVFASTGPRRLFLGFGQCIFNYAFDEASIGRSLSLRSFEPITSNTPSVTLEKRCFAVMVVAKPPFCPKPTEVSIKCVTPLAVLIVVAGYTRCSY